MLSLAATFDWSVDFDAPRYLLLLVLMPIIWLAGRRSLAALGAWRRRTALFLRLAVASLIILALAEPNWLTLMHRLTVLFVVDASDSIKKEELDQALKYVNAAAEQRDAGRGDRAGMVVFGRSPAVEIPPVAHPWRVARIESQYDKQFTNLESALQLAEATLPTDSGRRVVVVSDGNENIGQALPQATKMLASGIGFDCVPISYERHGEIVVEKVVVPSDIRRGTPFSLNAVVNNLSDHAVDGKLHITRELAGAKQTIVEEAVTLAPGKRVFTIRQELDESGMMTYEARFVPDKPADDSHTENNLATSFCRVSGNGHVLLIEDASQIGRFDPYVSLLRKNEIEVTVRDSRRPFDNLADLQEFDSVILADVARVAGEAPAELTQFTDEQIHQLVQNTEHFGCGLVVLGGPNSYGAGGWTNSELEKALPVDFQIQSAKVNAVGALMLVIDSSGSMTGEKIAWSKAAAVAASKMLTERDYVGVVTFDSESHWIVPMQRNGARERTKARIDRIGAAGGTDLMPALREAYRVIQGVDASLKHVVVLTDGHTPKDQHAALATEMRQKGITTTGVAVGRDADRVLLADLGNRGGGKFYQVLSPNAIPKIFMREARRVAMPLVFEDRNGIATQVAAPNELLSGIQGSLPPITGYVLTTLKQSPLVDVLLATPRQPQPNSAILATWQFGLGRSVALTTDVGNRWASSWPEWCNYDKLMLQMIRWSMRKHDANEKFSISTEARDGLVHVIATALDRDDASLSALNLGGTIILPGGTSQSFLLEEQAPGRYIAKVPAGNPGNYYVVVSAVGGAAPLRAAVNVAATAELERLSSYDGYLAQIAEGVPRGGERGILIQAPRGIADTEALLAIDVFRSGFSPAKSRNAIWPLLLIVTSVLFLGDVFCRRVLVSFDWLPAFVNRLTGHRNQTGVAEEGARMERLRKSIATATAQFASVENSTRYKPLVSDSPTIMGTAAEISVSENTLSDTASLQPSTEGELPNSEFTSRLFEAKKRVRDNQQWPKDG